MSESMTIARPYAKAVFHYAKGKNALASWANMLKIGAQVAVHPEIARVIANPLMPTERIKQLLESIVGKYYTESGCNFLNLLCVNRRLACLPEIYYLFEAYKAKAENTIKVNLISAFTVTQAQKERFTKMLAKRFDAQIVLSTKVDTSLIGGAIIRFGDKVIDGSLRGRLAQLSDNLIA